jgi:hypothetical protein
MGAAVAGSGSSFTLTGDNGLLSITSDAFTVFQETASQRLSFTLRVKVLGPLGIVTFEVLNSDTAEARYSLGFHARLYVEGNAYPPCRKVDGGFSVEGVNRLVYFLCQDSPLVVNASAYWFGPYLSRVPNQWSQVTTPSYSGQSGMALSWHNRTIAGGATDSVSVVVRWGPAPAAPVLALQGAPQSPVTLDTPIALTGTVTGTPGTQYGLYTVVDGHVARLAALLADRPIGSPIALRREKTRVGSEVDRKASEYVGNFMNSWITCAKRCALKRTSCVNWLSPDEKIRCVFSIRQWKRSRCVRNCCGNWIVTSETDRRRSSRG